MPPAERFDSPSRTARSRRRRPSRRAALRQPWHRPGHLGACWTAARGREPRQAGQQHREQPGQEGRHAVNPHVSRTRWSVVSSGGPSRSSPSSPDRANPRPRDRKSSRERSWGENSRALAVVGRRHDPRQPHRRPVTKAASGGRTSTVSQPPRWSIARRAVGTAISLCEPGSSSLPTRGGGPGWGGRGTSIRPGEQNRAGRGERGSRPLPGENETALWWAW